MHGFILLLAACSCETLTKGRTYLLVHLDGFDRVLWVPQKKGYMEEAMEGIENSSMARSIIETRKLTSSNAKNRDVDGK